MALDWVGASGWVETLGDILLTGAVIGFTYFAVWMGHQFYKTHKGK